MTATSSSNTYRKVRALIAKTVANGCTPGEAVSAANLASKIIADHNLDPARIDWPAPPAGYGWDGEPGRGGQMVEQPKAEKPRPARKAATPRSTDGERLADVVADAERKPRRAKKPTAEAKVPRKTVGERLVEMLRRPNGVTIADIMAEFGVQAHSARALISVEARKSAASTSGSTRRRAATASRSNSHRRRSSSTLTGTGGSDFSMRGASPPASATGWCPSRA